MSTRQCACGAPATHVIVWTDPEKDAWTVCAGAVGTPIAGVVKAVYELATVSR